MGGLFSRIIKDGFNDSKHSPPKEILFDDPRSPSDGIQRTPIVIPGKKYLETDIDNVTPKEKLPLRVQLLQKAMDPRSPSAGINRTPLTLDDNSKSIYFDSPVSIYSNYQTGPVGSLTSLVDPSMNVSGLDDDTFAEELDNLVEKIEKSLNESEVEQPPPIQKMVDPEIKEFCRELINEIIESFKECEETIDEQKATLPVVKKLSLCPENITPRRSLKSRRPLSNITHISNTPNKVSKRTSEKLVKVPLLGENSPVAHTKSVARVQWDAESTLII